MFTLKQGFLSNLQINYFYMGRKNNVNGLSYHAQNIKKIQVIINTILANTAYHDKNMDKQMSSPNAEMYYTDEEKVLAKMSHIYRNFKATQLMNEFIDLMKQDQDYLDYLKSEYPNIFKDMERFLCNKQN